jgi:hypothetical protein
MDKQSEIYRVLIISVQFSGTSSSELPFLSIEFVLIVVLELSKMFLLGAFTYNSMNVGDSLKSCSNLNPLHVRILSVVYYRVNGAEYRHYQTKNILNKQKLFLIVGWAAVQRDWLHVTSTAGVQINEHSSVINLERQGFLCLRRLYLKS